MIPTTTPRAITDLLHKFARGGTLPAMQKLTTRSRFARLASVNPSTITRLVETVLKGAVVGKHIDEAHPDAVAYLSSRDKANAAPVATGLDPMYEEAVRACVDSGKWSPNFLSGALKMGRKRAARILASMAANGVTADAPPPPGPEPVLRGQAAAKEKKKSAPVELAPVEVPEAIEAFADMTLRDLIDKFGTDTRFVDWLSATQKIEVIAEKRLKNAQTEGALVSRELVRLGVIEPIDAAHIKLLTDGAKTIARRATAMHAAERPLEDIEKFVADQISSFIRPVKVKVSRALKNA